MPVAAPSAQEARPRFSIGAVADSTVDLVLGGAGWVRAGMRGAVVDPRRRDALVARVTVLTVTDHTAVALVTGQTAPLSTEMVALIPAPPLSWLRQRAFWAGTLVGLALGVAVAALAGR